MDFHPLAIPQNASLLAQVVLGSSSGPGQGVLVNTWAGEQQTRKGEGKENEKAEVRQQHKWPSHAVYSGMWLCVIVLLISFLWTCLSGCACLCQFPCDLFLCLQPNTWAPSLSLDAFPCPRSITPTGLDGYWPGKSNTWSSFFVSKDRSQKSENEILKTKIWHYRCTLRMLNSQQLTSLYFIGWPDKYLDACF